MKAPAPTTETAGIQNARPLSGGREVLFAKTSGGMAIGVVSDSEPSSLTLLAAGVAGMAARRARLELAKAKAK